MHGEGYARLRVELTYLWRFGRQPDLERPTRFTEWVQWRKLNDRSPDQPQLLDKVASKKLATHLLGREAVLPLLWTGEIMPMDRPFGAAAMVKSRHGCKQYQPVRNDAEWRAAARRSERWRRRSYGGWLDEWAYRDIPAGLMAECLLGDGRTLPVDYKIYVFGGQATHIQVHLDRASDHRWILHDRYFRQLVPSRDKPPPPRSLKAMLEAAEILSQGRDFLRVDFFEGCTGPLFGEFALYPGSGLDPFGADWVDFELGRLWHAARKERSQSATHGNARQLSPNVRGDAAAGVASIG
ncbi:hypothetical protein MKP08_08520 [Erythrobacter sp. LQ02-29]|uniref:ATP-grasp fold amidoligase family protein n=1 Tax=Erythrobacter sp. LQ02-29 TaxID=2920384 RepID=UPI001F4DD902|nr:ATP-grasp fold amidoligase family protein [Erythrobacter sp. LQ02-29]MCP9222788.1 hypothetical protein [Erythrobacter sp. LQ02-29]